MAPGGQVKSPVARKKRRKRQGGGKPVARSRPRLSLCVIARDEGQFLDQCLASVAGLVDEIVVVDTGSSDDTMAVARNHGARLFQAPWAGDFSEARNHSLQKARGDWILVLDCDEVLSPDDGDGVRRAMASGDAEAYRLTTRNYTAALDRVGFQPCDGSYAREEGGYPGWFPTTKVRLWRRRPAVRFHGAVHELVEPALGAAGMAVGDCPVPVHHYGYVAKERPADRYLEAGERKVAERPGDLRARYELAIAYRDADRQSEALGAIEAVRAGLTDSEGADEGYLEEELVLLVHGDILERLGRPDAGLAVYREAVERFPASFQAHNNLGAALGRRGDVEGARACYRRGLELAPDNAVLADNLARLERATRASTPPPGATGSEEAPTHSLSVCVIARDASADLARCLASVAPVADQIVVVDTGSTDDTVAVAERAGAAVSHFSWCDDFSAARNASLDRATGDWVLWLDADDYLSPDDRDKVGRARNLPPDQALYFTLVNTGGADRTRFRQVKMFPNRPEIRFERPVHETVVPSLKRLGIGLAATDVEVRHTGYADPSVTARKSAYYRRIMEGWLQSHPEDYDFCFRVGHTHYGEGRRDDARAHFSRIIEAGPGVVRPASIYVHAATFRGRCDLEEGNAAGAVPDLEGALSVRSDDAFANLSLGDALTKMGQPERAIEHLRRSLTGQLDPHFPLDAELLKYSAHFFLGMCHQALGRFRDAEVEYGEANRLQPDRPEAAEALRQSRISATVPQAPGAGHSGPDAKAADSAEPAVQGVPAVQGDPDSDPSDGGAKAPQLTLCMIVRDEEARLGDCLESVRGLVDEIVVVDTGSVDETVAVAKRHGARLGHFEWCDDFSAARNTSLAMASGDWVMWLDADDLMPAEYHGEIRRLIRQGTDRSYFFVLDDQGYENVSCLQMRLFPNRPGVEFEMPIHEQVTPSLARLGLEMVQTDVRVVHTGYTTPDVVNSKKDRYLRIMEDWLAEHPESYIVRSHVALTYHTTGRLDEAVAQYRAILEESTCLADHNYVVYTTALLFLGRTYAKLGQHEEALRWILKAAEVDSDYVLTRFSLAETYLELGQLDRALEYATSVLDGEWQMTFFPIDRGEITYSALCVCGRAHQRQGQLDEAEAYFRRASEVPVKRRADAWGSLSEVYKARGDRGEALGALATARQMDPDSIKHIFNTAMIHMESGDLEEAGGLFNQVLERNPTYAPALLNLGFIAKSRGEVEEAERLYLRLLEDRPDHLEGRANLAHLYLTLERYEEAAASFEAVRDTDSGLLDINLGLLLARASQGTWEVGLALDILTGVGGTEASAAQLQDAGAATELMFHLGASLVRGGQLKCAEFSYRAAVLLAEGGGAAVDALIQTRRSLGEVLVSQGQIQQAVEQFEALLMANPADGAAFQRLGDCYQQLGVTDAASMCYEKAQALGEKGRS